jgi:hypothetical protein
MYGTVYVCSNFEIDPTVAAIFTPLNEGIFKAPVLQKEEDLTAVINSQVNHFEGRKKIPSCGFRL